MTIYGTILLVLLLFTYPVDAARISGTVHNAQTGRSVSDVQVILEENDLTTRSDSSGSFLFATVASGSYSLLFLHDKLEPLRLTDVFVPGDREKKLDVSMAPLLTTLDTMRVRAHAFVKAPDMATSTKTMTFDEILRSPGALVDVQRVVQNLPSVSSAGDNTNEIIVRGGNRGENLLLLDNIEIPNPNHFAEQGSGGGVISLVNPLLVKGITFCAGAPPANYGGKAASVLDVKLRDGTNSMVLGGVDIGFAGAGLHVEGPLWPHATFMASVNKSYLDLFARFAESTAIPHYWGAQAKVTEQIGNHKVYGNLIYGENGITIVDAAKNIGSNGEHIESGGMIYASGVSWEAYWTERLATVLTLSGVGNTFDRYEYSDSTVNGITVIDTSFFSTAREEEQTLALQSSYELTDNTTVKVGVQGRRCIYSDDLQDRPDTVWYRGVYDTVYGKNIQTRDVAYKGAGFVSVIMLPRERLKLIPGFRVDYFTATHSTTVAPRLGMVYALTPDIDLTSSAGLQYQEPGYNELLADPENSTLKPRRVETGVVGIEYLYRKYTLRLVAELFYKKYTNYPVDFAQTTADQLDQSSRLIAVGSGRSYGVELFVHKKLTNHFFATTALSLSRSYQRDIRPATTTTWLRGDYDFRTMVTLTGGYKFELLTKRWYKELHDSWWLKYLSPVLPIADRVELSAKWRYLGGRPCTRPTWSDDYNRWITEQKDYRATQYPAYHRLDIRFERRYGFGLLQMIYYFDLQNVYNKKNIWTYIYSDRKGRSGETPIYQFQFFPAGGVIIGF